MSQMYNYKKPRTINWVTILVFAGLAAVAYASWKFGPVYWKGYKVDEILSEYKNRSADLSGLNPTYQSAESAKIREEVYRRVKELGIEDTETQPLEVDFGPDFSYLYVKYEYVVRHPLGKTTTMKFLRKASIPKARGL